MLQNWRLCWGITKSGVTLRARSPLLVSKMDPIKYIFEKSALSKRIARWQMILTEYDIHYTTQKAMKWSVLDDHLAHQAVEDY